MQNLFKRSNGLPKDMNVFAHTHTHTAAETHPADGQFWQVAVNREKFLKLQGKT